MIKKYLLVQLGSYGDCLYATTIARQIKNNEPECHLTWAISEKYKSILIGNPDVNNIWEISNSKGYIFGEGHLNVEKEAEFKRKNGEFDQIIYSQILPKNIYNYKGTIRSSILQSYKNHINVNVSPILNLIQEEIDNVNEFISKNNILNYKYKILFECGPTSNQSKKINLDFALKIAKAITSQRLDTCFILSSNKKLENTDTRIFDANILTYRENAELINHCDLLIGCSSGITWLATSTWCGSKIPQIQLLDSSYPYFSGVCYDFEQWGLDSDKIIERLDFDNLLVIQIINDFFASNFTLLKEKYHQIYKVNYEYWNEIIFYGLNNNQFLKTIKFILNQKNNNHNLKYNKIINIFLNQISIYIRNKTQKLLCYIQKIITYMSKNFQ